MTETESKGLSFLGRRVVTPTGFRCTVIKLAATSGDKFGATPTIREFGVFWRQADPSSGARTANKRAGAKFKVQYKKKKRKEKKKERIRHLLRHALPRLMATAVSDDAHDCTREFARPKRWSVVSLLPVSAPFRLHLALYLALFPLFLVFCAPIRDCMSMLSHRWLRQNLASCTPSSSTTIWCSCEVAATLDPKLDRSWPPPSLLLIRLGLLPLV